MGTNWLDFLIVPMVDTAASLSSDAIAIELVPHVTQPVEATIQFLDKPEQQTLVPDQPMTISRELATAER